MSQPCSKETEINSIHDTLKKIEWLADPEIQKTIKEIILQKKSLGWIGGQMVKILTVLATVGAIIGAAIGVHKYLR